MAPGSTAKLEESVKVRKKNITDTTVPVCAVKLAKGGSFTALQVPMWPTPDSQGLMPEETRPDSEEIRKELFTFLSKCRGTITCQSWHR